MSKDPSFLRGPRFKNCQPHCQGDVMCRLLHHYFASRSDPKDGEALLYIASALLEKTSSTSPTSQRGDDSVRLVAMDRLTRASILCPCDARVWNNLGLVTARLGRKDLTIQAERAYETCLQLLLRTQQAGCEVSSDIDACRLNYGLFVSYLDRFKDAAEILEPLLMRAFTDPSNHVAVQAEKLWQYCHERHQLQES